MRAGLFFIETALEADSGILFSEFENGNQQNVDLSVGDIAGGALVNLPPTATASNFGKMSDKATDNDFATAMGAAISAS